MLVRRAAIPTESKIPSSYYLVAIDSDAEDDVSCFSMIEL